MVVFLICSCCRGLLLVKLGGMKSRIGIVNIISQRRAEHSSSGSDGEILFVA